MIPLDPIILPLHASYIHDISVEKIPYRWPYTR